MLNNCRALDLTDEKGFLCGKILADLGVEVIKVERPGGDEARTIGPFYRDIPAPDHSLYWWAYNSNKKGLTLNLESGEGRDLFRRLAAGADFIIESFKPGYLDSLELGYTDLVRLKRDIILTSITPFGPEGRYRDYQVTDIVSMAMSGILYQTGDLDTRPVHMSLPQACLHAGADAAVGTLLAYYHREQSGEGQQVDVSLQQSTAWFLANAIPMYELNQIVSRRSGSFRWSMKSSQRQVWKCRDGFVFFNIIGGRTGAKTLFELVQWMESEGYQDEYLHNTDWERLDMFAVNQDVVDRISRPIETFFGNHTRAEIAEGAARRRISVCPLSSMQDLHNDRQLAVRDFWTKVRHPGLEEDITYPRSYIKSSVVDYKIDRPAPQAGQHNQEIYGSLGLSAEEQKALSLKGVI
ncbi:MAG TPA: CoA transferase [Dehalococcoidales bacterium]|nr:CoA transferase [Dehalococcoidales bacterium]